jgi:prolipoprotein diacylglyceryl transferase
MQQPLAYIPSPSRGLIHLGPLPLRGYALMIIIGVVAAVWLGERRWAARGGTAGTVVDVAVWAVPFGLVGGRLYHVITDYQLYFGDEWHVARVFEVWKGGLGIWGAIAAGGLGAYIGCHRRGVSLRTFADAAAPGIALAQAFGRWGNWFNQELYGRPTKLPWAVKIDPAHRVSTPDIGTYHPTFLYESLWCIGVAVLVIWAEKRFRLAYGRTFALYVAAYTVGRAWIEWLRVDSAHHILGLRLNDWTSLIVFLGAVAYLYFYRDRTEIPEGAVGPATTDPTATPENPSDPENASGPVADSATVDDSATVEDAVGKEAAGAADPADKSDKADESSATGKSAADAPEPADEPKASAMAKDSTTAAEITGAETTGAETAAKTSDGEPKAPGDEAPEGSEPETAESKAAAPKASKSKAATDSTGPTESDGSIDPTDSGDATDPTDIAGAGDRGEAAESGEGDSETPKPRRRGKARASTGADPGERES